MAEEDGQAGEVRPSRRVAGPLAVRWPHVVEACAASCALEPDADVLWLDHLPSRGRLRNIDPRTRLTVLPGLDRLLDPGQREGLLAEVAARGGRLGWPKNLRPCLSPIAAPTDVYEGRGPWLVMRCAESPFVERWRVEDGAGLRSLSPALARRLAACEAGRLGCTMVALRGPDILQAYVHADVGILEGASTSDATQPVRASKAVAADVLARTRLATRILVGCVREDVAAALVDAGRGEARDVQVLAFEWMVGEQEITLLDVVPHAAIGMHRASSDEELTRALAFALTSASPPPEWISLEPQGGEPAWAELLPVPRRTELDVSPPRLATAWRAATWTPLQADVGLLGGLPIVLDARRNELLPLDPVAAHVRARLAEQADAGTLADEIADSLQVEPAQVEHDIWRLLAQWSARGLVARTGELAADVCGGKPCPRRELRAATVRLDASGRGVDLHLEVGADASRLRSLLPPTWTWAEPGPGAAARLSLTRASDGRYQLDDGYHVRIAPGLSWLGPLLFDAVVDAATDTSAPAARLCGGLVRYGDTMWIVVGPARELVDGVVALLAARAGVVLAAPVVALDRCGTVVDPRPLGLSVSEPLHGSALAALGAWRDARPLPRLHAGPVRLLALPPVDPAPCAPLPHRLLHLSPGRRGPVSRQTPTARESLELVLRDGRLGAGRLGVEEAEALVALADRVPMTTLAAHNAEAVVAWLDADATVAEVVS